MNIQKLNINDLNPATYNPRKDLKPGDKEFEKIKRSIETYGYIDPIIVNADLTVIGGHQRLKVLKALKYDEIDCVVVDVDKDNEKALNVALNKISGDWDYAVLAELLGELNINDFDLSLTGFDQDEIDAFFNAAAVDEVKEDDFDVDKAVREMDEPITQPGDVWVLGRHRLICGDATKASDLQRLMDGQLAEMVFTDPPYNVDYVGKTKDALKIQNDKMTDSKFYNFLFDFYSAILPFTRDGGAIYICHADSEGANFRQAMKDAGWLLKQCLIWVKNTIVMGRQDYHWKHEPILYGWKPGAAHRWQADRKQSTVIEDMFGVTIKPGETSTEIHITSGVNALTLEVPSYSIKFAGNDETTSVWRIERPTRNADHPTMKPVALPARAIRNSSKIGEIVLDTFGGSGSTLIAAEQTGRRGFLSELDPKYCDVIVKRWEELTGQKAERVMFNAEATSITGK